MPKSKKARRRIQTRRYKKYYKGIHHYDFGVVPERIKKYDQSKGERRTFSCPECGETLSVNLIRLRGDLWECRQCKNVFIKEEAVDGIDFEENE